ncbi:MAG: DNA repair protein RecN [Bacteroidales bacterium]|jgi:DNA repair protein RecN (Recombination protein N)|nr:DNA repair protein RecN [Bacteroidales bacterium]
MLNWLKIQNYLLLNHLEIHFPNGFISITGETGAGKSVLIGAISLLTGKRADTSVLLDKSRKSVIEAEFDVSKLKLQPFFKANDLDYDTECILRREITGQGKSRAFINDTPVRLEQLQTLSEYLIDIHSQHQSLKLGQHDFQRNILDSVASLQSDLDAYRKQFLRYKEVSKTLKTLLENQKKALEEKDFLEFQFNQLNEAELQENELLTLEETEHLLSNAEEIKSALVSGADTLQSDEISGVEAIRQFETALAQIIKHFPKAETYVSRLKSVRIELADILESCQQDADNIEYDPQRLLEIQERINLLTGLLQKHNAEDTNELIQVRDEIDAKLLQFQSDDSRINDLEKSKQSLLEVLLTKGERITEKRKKTAPALENKLRKMLAELGMPQAQFVVEIHALNAPAEDGLDEICFLFSANPDMPAQNIQKVASGGEMSRLMLCLKSIVAEFLHLPSIVFDEIDTGVSGEIAGRMGEMMKALSEKSQVISITHLPQVAALGVAQYHVTKAVENSQTRVQILKLSGEDRIREIARMSSGKNLTETAMQHAKDLLNIKI